MAEIVLPGGGVRKIVQIEFTMEPKDAFRYYLSTVKTRLFIAVLIYGVVTGGIACFFAFIGELETLLLLTPLFFGLPGIAIGGQLLRAHATYRKYISQLSDDEKHCRVVFTGGAECYEVFNGENSSRVSWKSVRAVRETAGYFEIEFNKYEKRPIWKHYFRDEADHEEFRWILRDNIGARARLVE